MERKNERKTYRKIIAAQPFNSNARGKVNRRLLESILQAMRCYLITFIKIYVVYIYLYIYIYARAWIFCVYRWASSFTRFGKHMNLYASRFKSVDWVSRLFFFLFSYNDRNERNSFELDHPSIVVRIYAVIFNSNGDSYIHRDATSPPFLFFLHCKTRWVS